MAEGTYTTDDSYTELNGQISITGAGADATIIDRTVDEAISGGFWGSLIGLLFLNPLLGFGVGAAAGAVSGALHDVGINDSFMKSLAGNFNNGSSLLFVLVRKATPDKVLAELQGTGGTVVRPP